MENLERAARLTILTLCVLGAGTAGVLASAAPSGLPWEKVADDDGIITYQLPSDASGVVSFKGEATIEAGLEDVAAAMEDNATAAEWLPMVAERRDLKVLSATDRIEYTHMAMPWPVTDRYFIDHGHIDALPGGGVRLTVESVAAPEAAWLEKDKVLAVFHHSEFRLTPLGSSKTRLVFELHSEAGGQLPQWLVHMAQRNWPRDFVQGLTGQLAKRGKLANRLSDVSPR